MFLLQSTHSSNISMVYLPFLRYLKLVVSVLDLLSALSARCRLLVGRLCYCFHKAFTGQNSLLYNENWVKIDRPIKNGMD